MTGSALTRWTLCSMRELFYKGGSLREGSSRFTFVGGWRIFFSMFFSLFLHLFSTSILNRFFFDFGGVGKVFGAQNGSRNRFLE